LQQIILTIKNNKNDNEENDDEEPLADGVGNGGSEYDVCCADGLLPKDAQLDSSCLFGEHLLSRYPDSVVALVESPKNALFGALAHPRLTWVATGSKNMLKRDVLKPLRGRNVIVIPDCDAVEEWSHTVATMKDLTNFTVSDFCQRMAPANQPKYDIADYIVEQNMPF
jgi:hypothetical protein